MDLKHGVIQDDALIETLTYSSILMTRPRGASIPAISIELAQHDDGRWMWSASIHHRSGYGRSYRVGPKWGNFAASRQAALIAAIAECRERQRYLPSGADEWLDSLSGLVPEQMDLLREIA